MRRQIWGGLIACLFALSAFAAAPQPPTAPSPSLGPAETVAAMLAALKRNDDKGIARLFEFSSPQSKEKTGPLDKFSRMIREGFPDMLGHRASRQTPALVQGDRAKVAVELISSDGQTRHYGFMLSKQDIPKCRGCWMADAVLNLDDDPGEGEGDDGGGGGDGGSDAPGATRI